MLTSSKIFQNVFSFFTFLFFCIRILSSSQTGKKFENWEKICFWKIFKNQTFGMLFRKNQPPIIYVDMSIGELPGADILNKIYPQNY